MINLYKYEDIEFRKADRQDLKDLLELKNESWFGTHTVTLANSISQEKWLESISTETHSPKDLMLIAEIIKTTTDDYKPEQYKQQIGVFKILHIDWQNRRAEAGWDIYHHFRGKGYGKKIVKPARATPSPVVVSASAYIENITHEVYRPGLLMRIDESIPHELSLTKKAVAFFKISFSIRKRRFSVSRS